MGIRKHIPNTVTSMNLICGIIGVIVALNGNLMLAFILMLAAAVFDFFDGFAARLLKAYSDIGKELDSLADDVSFGVLPAVMLYCIYGTDLRILRFFPLVLAAFSALRLAKFNLDERQHSSFIGLPTPACAMICGSMVCLAAACPDSFLAMLCMSDVFIPVLTIALSFLLVSNIPMFAMKVATGTQASKGEKTARVVFFAVAAASAAVTVIWKLNWCVIPFVTFVSYVLINVIRTVLDGLNMYAPALVFIALSSFWSVSCSRKVESDPDTLPLVNILVEESSSVLENLVAASGKTSGSIAVIGDPDACLKVAGTISTCDLFDNIDAKLSPDGLPDFAGETVIAILDSSSFKVGGETLREAAVRLALCAMDSTVACKMLVFCGRGFPDYGSSDVEDLFSRIGCDIPVVASSDTSADLPVSLAKSCFKVLRDRNMFTHDICYPVLLSYASEYSDNGSVCLSDLKSVNAFDFMGFLKEESEKAFDVDYSNPEL